MISEVLASFGVLLVGLLGMFMMQRKVAAWERRYIWASFVAHILSAIALIMLTIYFFGGGDLLAYHGRGELNAMLLMSDFGRYARPFMLFVLRLNPGMKLDFAETSTGVMIGLSTWLHILLFGSIYAKGLLIAVLGVPTKFLLYKGLSSFFHRDYHRHVLWACMLIPSVVFWTSGLLKEPIAMLGMGPLVYGSALLIHGRRRLYSLLFISLGAFIISLVKAYILFPWLIASLVCYYWHRNVYSKGGASALVTKPIYMVVAAGFSVAGIVVLGEAFPRYSISEISNEIGNLQVIGQRTGGGSNYTMGQAPARSQNAQLLLLPMGLLFSLFRPLIFEVRNAALFLNAIETTGILLLWIRLLFVRPPRQTIGLIMKTPGIMAALVFVILFGSVVGIATTNVGTLSRYRIPMMPFYFSMLLILSRFPAPSTPRA